MRTKIGLIILFFVMLVGIAAAENNQDLLSLENKYIKIFVNNGTEETGRFAVDVTLGDPGRSDDDNKPLIYGHPKPWTSYTTIQINGQNYVFGKETAKRSGAGVPGGEIIEAPKLANSQITMKCKYGSITAEQILEIVRSPSTGALDTAAIKYVIENQGGTTAEIGLRTLLDTMVGDNDGAPFRVGEKEITYEYTLNKGEYPDFWQAFDSLSKPSVIAQNTLEGSEVTPPDRVVFTNWGKAADQPWNFPVEAGAQFTRLGEEELDSAVAMYWNPHPLKPGEKLMITIYYGLGGITFSPGKTFLGISAPATMQYFIKEGRNYSIVMYLEHRGEAKATNVKVNLNLPSCLDLVSGETQTVIPELIPGVTKQFIWEVKPNGRYIGDINFEVKVSGDGLEANQVSRSVKISGPPVLNASLNVPLIKVVDNKWEPNPLPLTLKLKNIGEDIAHDLNAVLKTESGLQLATGERNEKLLPDLEPGAETTLLWHVEPTLGSKTGKLTVSIDGSNIVPLTFPTEMAIPTLPVRIYFSEPGVLKVGQVAYWELLAFNLTDAAKVSLDIKYDPKQLNLVYISRGIFLVEDSRLSDWSSGTINTDAGVVTGVNGSRLIPFSGAATILARLNFITAGKGQGEIEVDNLKIYDSNGKELPFEIIPNKYQIEEVQK